MKSKNVVLCGLVGVVLAACGGFVYTTVGGSVTGLVSGDSPLVLTNESNYTVRMTADGSFSFNVASNGLYTIKVASQPIQTNCVIANGSGRMTGESAVTNINVTCSPNVKLSGTISGLDANTGISLVLNQNTDYATAQTFAANGEFIFTNRWAVNGDKYNVTVGTPPVGKYCTVTNGSRVADIKNASTTSGILVDCVSAVPVKFEVTGMASNTTLVLVNTANGITDKVAISANGIYNFPFSWLDGTSYVVTVDTQPLSQTCKVENASGKVSIANPDASANIKVTCAKT